MPTRFSSVPSVVTSSPFSSSIATPWCASADLYVRVGGLSSPRFFGSKIVTSPVPSVNSTVRPA